MSEQSDFQKLLREKRERVKRKRQRALGSNGAHRLIGERFAEGFAFSNQGTEGPC